ncbi:restriction endonuclease [Campylobacter sp. MIT 21-1685]|uniref:restriction endonuclease n=1 Tax=unclassified Campylobacter TaxID=2593542 RepID=UPI00224B1A59|nr:MULTISPECIES: restriction endonuclease [unclassified Campylobacter]MCX2683528.1 restriction endonuclease [Campylobacter sp. MIT 21-1684]MCX2751813.1 restriction endonuclease [Campylobacter sp. MIT 21-1682]MCX2808010.1 restriction endonuclease [Campylobacter sp. MIT 21-1685]
MIKELLLQIIEEKHKELQNFNQSGIFDKIKDFEGNAIGQIGEKFVKEVFRNFKIPLDEIGKEIIHDEFDLLSLGKKIEIKTARKGLKNNTFQFNGINPKYNYDYIILIAISYDDVYYYIINKKFDYIYDHKLRKEFIKINDKPKQLVQMNPGNAVNLKLTLNLKELKNIENFVNELQNIF